MPKRICDACGKERDVSGGKVCAQSHFVCKECVWAGTGGGFFSDGLKQCPLDKSPLR